MSGLRPCYIFLFSLRKSLLLPLLFTFGVLAGLSGCSNTRYLSEGQQLYIGANVELQSDKQLPNEKEVEAELDELIRPKPNFSIFGLRPTLWVYNIMGTPRREKGIRSWIKNKVGEPPVLFEEVDPDLNVTIIDNRLNNQGYFQPEVTYETEEEDRKVTLNYLAQVNQPYRIKEVIFPQGDTLINKDIRETQKESLLDPGDIYNLDMLTQERERIDAELKNKGYYYFNPDFIIFKVDSTLRDQTLNVYVQVKKETPEQATTVYRINNVILDTNYSIGNDSLDLEEAVRVNQYYYFPDEDMFKSRNILQSVFLEKGAVYSRRDHQLTLSRLMGLGVFQYVNARFTEVDSLPNDQLDAHLFLTPMLKKSLRAELQGITTSTNFAGPHLVVDFRNRNALRGAELFQLNLTAGFESQVGGGSSLTSYELGANAELHVPRFITPFQLSNVRSDFVPKTRFALGFNFLNRVQYFHMNSYNATYGYVWRPRRTVTHDFTPINLQYVHMLRQDPRFQQRLAENVFLQRSFADQAIIGSLYNFTFNTQVLGDRAHHFHFNVNLDASGNVANLFKRASTSVESTPEQPYTLFGSPFSQYFRNETDLRYYFRPGGSNGNTLAYRVIVGAGIPYGNSTSLPYIKQFSIGGPNSIRAFRARSIGPGTYNVPDTSANSFFDQTGDIKFETNLEYRFGIIPYLKGAVFVDAGNIWVTSKEPPDERGGLFSRSSFLEELAVGTGFGLRVDAQFFVLRFDLGIPVRVPYRPLGERTVIDEFAPLSPAWRRENLVLNIAVGYPF